ncbi:MAG: hypothetical protein EAY75_13245 [Bacteroidetes bacterium]|nr:MAG: hypothetical protein EAY75_13245 [Bacteroidota bacterium]
MLPNQRHSPKQATFWSLAAALLAVGIFFAVKFFKVEPQPGAQEPSSRNGASVSVPLSAEKRETALKDQQSNAWENGYLIVAADSNSLMVVSKKLALLATSTLNEKQPLPCYLMPIRLLQNEWSRWIQLVQNQITCPPLGNFADPLELATFLANNQKVQ